MASNSKVVQRLVDPTAVLAHGSASSALLVPVAVWGRRPPAHNVSAVSFLTDGDTLVTGAKDGNIIVWRVGADSLQPQLFLLGHHSPVCALASTSTNAKGTCFVSAAENGQLCVWDHADGRCVDSATTSRVHRRIVVYRWKSSHGSRDVLICAGDYADLCVLDAHDLSDICTLSSRIDSDWISAFTIVQCGEHATDRLAAVSQAGMFKMWTLTELKSAEPNTQTIWEDESRWSTLRTAVSVSHHAGNTKQLLVVCQNGFHIVDATSLNVVSSRATDSVSMVAGWWMDVDKVAISYTDLSLRIWTIPLPNGAPSVVAMLESQKQTCIDWQENACWTLSGAGKKALEVGTGTVWQVARASANGRLLCWRLPSLHIAPTEHPLKYKGTFDENLSSIWNSFSEQPPALLNYQSTETRVTATLYVAALGRLFLGQQNGRILVLNGAEQASRALLQLAGAHERQASSILAGHGAAIRCLLYPAETHGRFDQQLLLSGGDDFAVCLWNVESSQRIHIFSVHSSPVTRFVVPPPTGTKLLSRCICSISEDGGVAVMNVKEPKCVLLATRHGKSVVEIRFRTADNFLLLRLDDASLHVWQLDTASLERVAHGLMADEMWTAAMGDSSEQSSMLDGAIAPESTALTTIVASASQAAPSMSVCRLMATDNTDSHVLIFNVHSLIETLTDMDRMKKSTADVAMEQTRLLLSLLFAWHLDDDLDTVCLKRLGIRRARFPLYFGTVSERGEMSLWMPRRGDCSFADWAQSVHWQSSHCLTTLHLLAVVALSNCLLSIASSPPSNNSNSSGSGSNASASATVVQQQTRQGWSLVAAMHCVLLPDHVKPRSSFAAPRIELLAARWHDVSSEMREAAQALLTRELKRLSSSDRRRLVQSWANFLPSLLDPQLSILGGSTATGATSSSGSSSIVPSSNSSGLLVSTTNESSNAGGGGVQSSGLSSPTGAGTMPHVPPRMGSAALPSTAQRLEQPLVEGAGMQQLRRNQATAVVVLGVLGAEHPEELEAARLTRATALSLLSLLVSPPSPILPAHSALRRAAIDLLGRGITVWQPHLDISKLLLALLDVASAADRTATTAPAGGGGTAVSDDAVSADAIRASSNSARQALSQIAHARAPAVLTALSKEVARYNLLAQHQTIQHTVTSPLLRARTEVLRIIEQLAEKQPIQLIELMLPVGELLVHCLDTSLLKQSQLQTVFPPIARFPMVAYCSSTRRIVFGAVNGQCAMHELRSSKCTVFPAHSGPLAAVAFSEDGKMLATYGSQDNTIQFWQTSTGFLGIGQSQMKLVRTQAVPALNPVVATSPSTAATRAVRLLFIHSKAISLMLADGKEHRFQV